jgi:beta-glucosidase
VYRVFSKSALFCAALSLATIATTYTGRVVDDHSPARPVSNATLLPPGSSEPVYTDSSGTFSFSLTGTLPRTPSPLRHNTISFSNGTVAFSSLEPQRIQLDLFTISGRKAVTLIDRTGNTGRHEYSLMSLLPSHMTPGMYMAVAKTAHDRMTIPLLLTATIHGMVVETPRNTSLRKTTTPAGTAASDNLTISRRGYNPATVPLTDANTGLGEIVLTRTAREKEIERKVDSLVALMTIDEKAGQMVQAQINFTNDYNGRLKNEQVAAMGIGSVFNGGSDESAAGQPNTPVSWAEAIDRVQRTVMESSRLKIPVLYGQDCVHGAAEIDGCTIFPHNIGLGCTGDTALVAKIGRITAEECNGIGVRLNFAPCIASVRNERWGRTYEGFGETPEINVQLGTAYIRGLQGGDNMAGAGSVAACAKHYLGDGATNDGVNNGETSLSDATVRAVHLPPYAAAARELVATVMPSYHTWIHHGESWKQTLDRYALTTVLKGELGFDGFCISDWDAVARACDNYELDCVSRAVNAGLDMAMIIGEPSCSAFINSIKAGVEQQIIPISRIDDAVRRILRIKFRFGLFDNPYSSATFRSQTNSTASKAVARESVRKSLVLLKNEDGVLPLKKAERIVVVGPWANSLGAQCGGWTISWQGSVDHGGISGQTILTGLQSAGTNVTFSESGDNISDADKIVVVVGEKPYAEQFGDCTVPDLSECPNAGLVEKCFNSGKPVVLVMITGRPMLIDTEINWCKAVVAAWLPGGEGGGVADVLFGDYPFTGKLTHTWPASAGQIPINDGPVYADEQKGSGGTPLFEYGYGLTY